jgi:KUP system potassium uptake protein
MFRCVVRKLFDSLSTFVRLESMMDGGSDSDDYSIYDQETEQQSDFLLNQTGNSVPLNVDGTISSGDSIRSINGHLHSNRVVASSGLLSSPSEINELEFMGVCRDAGVVHIL